MSGVDGAKRAANDGGRKARDTAADGGHRVEDDVKRHPKATAAGAATGAAGGAVMGGPPGAVVGGVLGAVRGLAAADLLDVVKKRLGRNRRGARRRRSAGR